MSDWIRVGDTVINLDSVLCVHLDCANDDGTSGVVFEFRLRGSDASDRGRNPGQPNALLLKCEEAEAVRRYFQDRVPDLLERPSG
jgi:hypothetical protein